MWCSGRVSEPGARRTRQRGGLLRLPDRGSGPLRSRSGLYGGECPAAPGRQRHTVAACLLRTTRDQIALIRSDLDVVTAATRSADLLWKGRALLLSLCGVRVDGKNWWLHVACTPRLTAYLPHRRRGGEAMDDFGTLTRFRGVAVHDGLMSYQDFGRKHARCNANHVRELVAAGEAFRSTSGPESP